MPLKHEETFSVYLEQIGEHILKNLVDTDFYPQVQAPQDHIIGKDIDQPEDPLPKLYLSLAAVMDQQLSKDIKGRVTGLGTQGKHLLRLQQQRVDLTQKRTHLLPIGMVTNGPNQR